MRAAPSGGRPEARQAEREVTAVIRLGIGPGLVERCQVLASAAVVVTALHPMSAAAVLPASNAALAARIAEQLGCQAFSYHPGASSASGSKGHLDCRLRRQDFDVYVFSTNRERAQGIAHLKLWSGPDDVYYFAQDRRAIIVPRGDDLRPAYTKRWATIAAHRTGGAVFSG